MAASSPPEEAPPAFVGAQLFFSRVELCRGKLLGPGLVRYDALLHLLIISSNAVDLPRTHDAVVQGVKHMEDVPASEAHLAFLRMLVVKVGPERKHLLDLSASGCSSAAYSLDVEGVALARGDDLLVLLAAVLDDQVDLLLQTEQEEHGLLATHTLHVHVVDLEDLVARLEALEGGRTTGLHRAYEDAGLVAAGEPYADRAFLLEGDEARVRPRTDANAVTESRWRELAAAGGALTWAACCAGRGAPPRRAAGACRSSPPA